MAASKTLHIQSGGEQPKGGVKGVWYDPWGRAKLLYQSQGISARTKEGRKYLIGEVVQDPSGSICSQEKYFEEKQPDRCQGRCEYLRQGGGQVERRKNG